MRGMRKLQDGTIMTTTITGHYFEHYGRMVRSKLTGYADARDIRVRNGTFRATLNPTLSERTLRDVIWSLEHSWHCMNVGRA